MRSLIQKEELFCDYENFPSLTKKNAAKSLIKEASARFSLLQQLKSPSRRNLSCKDDAQKIIHLTMHKR